MTRQEKIDRLEALAERHRILARVNRGGVAAQYRESVMRIERAIAEMRDRAPNLPKASNGMGWSQ